MCDMRRKKIENDYKLKFFSAVADFDEWRSEIRFWVLVARETIVQEKIIEVMENNFVN